MFYVLHGESYVYTCDSFPVQAPQRCSCSLAAADLLSSWHLFDVYTDFYWCSRVPGQLCTSRKFCQKVCINFSFINSQQK